MVSFFCFFPLPFTLVQTLFLCNFLGVARAEGNGGTCNAPPPRGQRTGNGLYIILIGRMRVMIKQKKSPVKVSSSPATFSLTTRAGTRKIPLSLATRKTLILLNTLVAGLSPLQRRIITTAAPVYRPEALPEGKKENPRGKGGKKQIP